VSTPTIALIASGTNGAGAVASRITAMASGLSHRGWHVNIHDVALTRPSLVQRLLDQTPASPRTLLERCGIEGDVMPSIGWRARTRLDTIAADAAIVSGPPFSLLAAGALAVPANLSWIVDYRDPCSARAHPPPLARILRRAERWAATRATAVTFAGGPRLADLLVTRLHITRDKIVAVPNGHDPHDLAGLPTHRLRADRNGCPLDLVFGGYWYGRNGPGILVDALARVGPAIASLTVIGAVTPAVQARIHRAVGDTCRIVPSMPRPQLYQRLAHADAMIIPLDLSSAVESRIPAKVYDGLATGTPIIALCPADAALLTVPGGNRIHHVDYRDTQKLASLFTSAAADRSVLRSGPLGAGPTRDAGIKGLDSLLRSVCTHPADQPVFLADGAHRGQR